MKIEAVDMIPSAGTATAISTPAQLKFLENYREHAAKEAKFSDWHAEDAARRVMAEVTSPGSVGGSSDFKANCRTLREFMQRQMPRIPNPADKNAPGDPISKPVVIAGKRKKDIVAMTPAQTSINAGFFRQFREFVEGVASSLPATKHEEFKARYDSALNKFQ